MFLLSFHSNISLSWPDRPASLMDSWNLIADLLRLGVIFYFVNMWLGDILYFVNLWLGVIFYFVNLWLWVIFYIVNLWLGNNFYFVNFCDVKVVDCWLRQSIFIKKYFLSDIMADIKVDILEFELLCKIIFNCTRERFP